jgi:hypothetical protein
MATATDGKTLAHCRWVEPPADQFPQVGIDPSPVNGSSVIIPTSAVKELQGLPAKESYTPILTFLAMGEKDLNGSAHFMGTDLATKKGSEVKTVEGTYPDFDAALKPVEGSISVRFNPEYLAQALDTIRKTMGRQCDTMVLTLQGDKPARLEARDGDLELTVLVMPLVTRQA